MSQMTYLRLEGLDGEEPIGSNSQKAIAISGYSHSLSMDIAPVRPSAGADVSHRRSMCQHDAFVVTKALDKTSTKLLSACASGVIFKHAVVYVCTQDFNKLTKSSRPEPFLSIVLTEAIIADFSYEFQGEWQVETLALNYTSISWHTDWRDPDKGDKSKLDGGWDATKNAVGDIAVPAALKWKKPLIP